MNSPSEIASPKKSKPRPHILVHYLKRGVITPEMARIGFFIQSLERLSLTPVCAQNAWIWENLSTSVGQFTSRGGPSDPFIGSLNALERLEKMKKAVQSAETWKIICDVCYFDRPAGAKNLPLLRKGLLRVLETT